MMKTVNVRGLTISQMTLGTVQLGMNYGLANTHGMPTLEESCALLDAALDGGVTCLDTARLYGESEQVIGAYLAKNPERAPVVVSKFKVDPAKGTDAKSILAQIEADALVSCKMLGLARLPLYMLHHAPDMTLYGSLVPDALRELKKRGVIERAGVSIYEAEQVDAMLRDELYEAIQLPMSALDQRLIRGGQIERLRQAERIVFVRSVFLQGLFFMKDMPVGFNEAQSAVSRIRALAERNGLPIASLALSFIRDIPGVTSLVLGSETVEQVQENVTLFDAPTLSAALMEELKAVAEEIPIERIMAEIRK